jgi:hypothetical protein
MKKPKTIAKKIWDKFDEIDKERFRQLQSEFEFEFRMGKDCKGYSDEIRASNCAILAVLHFQKVGK